MKIAVSGATGFLGRHVVAELERRSVSPLLICPPAKELPVEFARHTIVEMDLRSIPAPSSPLLSQVDTLIHLAWGGLPNYQSLHHFEDELPAQYRFLKTLIGAGFKNLVVAGTCLEYGMQSGPLTEDMDTRPANPYGLAKDALRRQLEYLQQVQPFNLNWARIFYLYGEGQSANSLLPQLQRAVESGDRVFKMSGGEQLRDYLPVGDVVSSLVGLALRPGNHGVVNVCSGKPTSVRKLVEGWLKEYSWPVELQLGHYPYPEHEPMAFWGKRDKLDRCLTR